MLESSLLEFVKSAFYDAPKEVRGLDVNPQYRKNVILLRAYLNYGQMLLQFRTDRNTYQRLTTLHKQFGKLIDSVCAALRDLKYDAFLAASAREIDKVAHHYTSLLRSIIHNPHAPDTVATVSDYIKHERDLKMLYLI